MDELSNIPEAPAPEAPERGLLWVFVGKNGIRAGWGILLFIVVFAAAAYESDFLVQNFFPRTGHGGPLKPSAALAGEGMRMVCVVVATGVLALIERKSILAYGYQGKARATRFFSGLVWGFIALSVLVFALWQLGFLAFDGRGLHGAEIWRYAGIWGLVFLCTAVFEESLLRGYLQFTMTRGVGFWWGALVFSVLFGLGHTLNPGESPVGLFSAGAFGLVCCLSLWYTGSLWWVVGFHAAWDWGESYFYGTSDSGLVSQGHLFGVHPLGKILWSGGKTGPEGSLLVLLLLGIVAILMWLWWGRRVESPFKGQGWRPAWSRRERLVDGGGLEEAG